MAVDFGLDSDIATIKGLSGTDTSWSSKITSLWRAALHSDNNRFGPNATRSAYAAGVGFPIGALVDYPASAAPSGFVACDGRSLSRTTHSLLYGVIGTRFGSDNSGTFKVPDFRRRQAVGRSAGSDVGAATGAEVTVMAEANLPSHTHSRWICLGRGRAASRTSGRWRVWRWPQHLFKRRRGGLPDHAVAGAGQ